MSPGRVNCLVGLLGLAPALCLGALAEAAKLHLRDSILAIECHWTTDDAVIVTRGSVAIRIAREDVLRIEDEGPRAATPLFSPLGSQCAYHWSVVVGVVGPSWTAA